MVIVSDGLKVCIVVFLAWGIPIGMSGGWNGLVALAAKLRLGETVSLWNWTCNGSGVYPPDDTWVNMELRWNYDGRWKPSDLEETRPCASLTRCEPRPPWLEAGGCLSELWHGQILWLAKPLPCSVIVFSFHNDSSHILNFCVRPVSAVNRIHSAPFRIKEPDVGQFRASMLLIINKKLCRELGLLSFVLLGLYLVSLVGSIH
jgi:hypothetical protein